MLGSIEVRTRPLRLAYLIDPDDTPQLRDAIRLSSSLWGGTFFPILPLYAELPENWEEPFKPPPAEKVILGYLDAFDPDVLVMLSNSKVPEFIANGRRQIVRGSEIWNVLHTRRPLVPQFGIGIFEVFGDVFEECFKYKAKYPARVVLPEMPEDLSLFWTAVFGELPQDLMPIVDKQFCEPLEIERVAFTPDKLPEMIAANVLFPRRIVEWALNHQSRGGFRERASVFFLDATKPVDIADFWNLRALGRAVLGVPKQLQTVPAVGELVVTFLQDHQIPWPHNPDAFDFASILRSRNSSMEELQAFARTLPRLGEAASNPPLSLQHWYPRIWDEWGRFKDGAVPDDFYIPDKVTYDVGESTGLRVRIKTTLPKFAEDFGYHDAPRCANDVSFQLFGSDAYIADVFPEPAGEHVIQAIGGIPSVTEEWRIGRGSLVRLVKYESADTVTIPFAEDIMFGWLWDLGWETKLSPPGILAKRVFKQLEGRLFALRDEKFLGLLEHMNGGKVQRDGSPVAENAVQPELERDLPIGHVMERVGGSYDNLVSRGVFRLGNRIQCPNCLRRSWFAVSALGESFTCPRCSESFAAIGSLTRGTWTYKTAGPFSVAGYADGAYAVLLTMEFFGESRMHSLRTTPLLSFKASAPGKVDLEADFAILWQETLFGEKTDGVLVGECKTYDEFKDKDFERMRYLAKTLPGAILVFSTLRKSLTETEAAEIRQIAKAGRAHWKADRPINPILVLTGTELLSLHGPPYCWTGEPRQKFDRIHGLLQTCNATQQIYLGLPSWEAEWHAEFEKRRSKDAEKPEQEAKP